MDKTQVTQLDEAIATLKGLAPNITQKDRAIACKKLGITPTTLSRYFNDKGRSLDTATKLVMFFRKRVDARQKDIC